MPNWKSEMTDRIGARVVTLRGDRSAKWLSERTAELGFPVSRSALSQLETGSRGSISLAEFLVLAAALEVPPALLLFPEYPDGIVEMLPGIDATSFNATEWVSGHQTFKMDKSEPELGYPGNSLISLASVRQSILGESITRFSKSELKDIGIDVIQLLKEMESKRDALNEAIKELGGTITNV